MPLLTNLSWEAESQLLGERLDSLPPPCLPPAGAILRVASRRASRRPQPVLLEGEGGPMSWPLGTDTNSCSFHSAIVLRRHLIHTPCSGMGMIYLSSGISYSTREPASWIVSYSLWIFTEDSKMRKVISARNTAEIKCKLSLEEDRERGWPFGLGWREAETLEVILGKLALIPSPE